MTRNSIAVLGSVLFFAVLLASFGLLALATNTDFANEKTVFSARGAAMMLVATFTFLLWQLSRKEMHILTRALVSGITVFLVIPLTSGIWLLFETGSFAKLTLTVGKYALSPYALAAGFSAAFVSIVLDFWVAYEAKRKG